MLDLAAANWNTALGAACFLACALAHAAQRPHDEGAAPAAPARAGAAAEHDAERLLRPGREHR